jgi:hypothetical protein
MTMANPYLDKLRALKKRETHHRQEPSKLSKPSFEGFEGDQSRPFFEKTLAALERRCPDEVDPDDWELAVEDGRRFLARWGEQAEALGWTSKDLFGLAPIPENPAPTYRRLSRYDPTGLVWLLRGCAVVALTDRTAAIQHATGNITIYRRHNKPAFGPLGDSLDDFVE